MQCSSKLVRKLTYSHDKIWYCVSDVCCKCGLLHPHVGQRSDSFSSCLVTFAELSVCSCIHDLHYSMDLLSMLWVS